MIVRHQLPTQSGTDLYPSPTSPTPSTVVVNDEGCTPEDTDSADDIIHRHTGRLNQFVQTQRQLYSLGIAPVHKKQLSHPEIDITYQNLHGKELITLRPKPRRGEPPPAGQDDRDPLLDGYILFWSATASGSASCLDYYWVNGYDHFVSGSYAQEDAKGHAPIDTTWGGSPALEGFVYDSAPFDNGGLGAPYIAHVLCLRPANVLPCTGAATFDWRLARFGYPFYGMGGFGRPFPAPPPIVTHATLNGSELFSYTFPEIYTPRRALFTFGDALRQRSYCDKTNPSKLLNKVRPRRKDKLLRAMLPFAYPDGSAFWDNQFWKDLLWDDPFYHAKGGTEQIAYKNFPDIKDSPLNVNGPNIIEADDSWRIYAEFYGTLMRRRVSISPHKTSPLANIEINDHPRYWFSPSRLVVDFSRKEVGADEVIISGAPPDPAKL